MMNKNQIITLVAVVVLLVLAFWAMSASKEKVPNNDVTENINSVENENEQNKVVGDDKLIETDLAKNGKTKNMTDIKEFSFDVLTKGAGTVAKTNDNVTVDYKGTFLDGKIFDQGTFPFTLGVGQVVAGFDKGVLGMQIGETRKIYIPSDMGYGERGAGASIPPNTDLIFAVTLRSIQ